MSRKKESDFVVQADEQTAGRGRKERSWKSPPGGLYFSLCTDRGSLLPLKASTAVAKVLEDLEVSPKLKWPNDVLVDRKKICGILVEGMKEKAVVGIGLNVETAPIKDSTCLLELLDQEISSDKLMKDIVQRFYRDHEVLEIYRKYCSTVGQKVKVSMIEGELTGTVADIDEKGRLVLEGGKKVMSGDVVHLKEKNER